MDYPEKRRVTWIDDGTGDLVGACDYYRHDLLEAANAENERLASRKKAEAERDEARAQVATLMKDRAELAQIIDSAITPNDAETHRLLLDGTYHTGPVVDWVHRVMIAMRDLLRKTPADAQAALEAYGREKVREGMKRAYDLSGQYHQVTHIRAAILAEMEALK